MSNRPDGAASRFRPGLVWSAALLAIVIIAGIAIAIIGQGSSNEQEPEAVPPAITPEEPTSASRCGLTASDQSALTTAGPPAEWELVGRIAVPTTEEHGPGAVEDGLRVCYSQTPAGAVVAAFNIVGQVSNPEIALSAYEEFLANGPGREAALEAYQETTGSTDVSVQFAGFQVLDFDEERALIDVVARGSNGVILSTPVELVWEAGDWRLALQDNGQPLIAPRTVPSLAGYVEWAGA